MNRLLPPILAATVLAVGCASTLPRTSSPRQADASEWRDALIVDASSSASTLAAYRWRAKSGGLPEIEGRSLPDGLADCEPVEPGLGAYGGRPAEAAASLEPLLRCVATYLGDDEIRLARAALHLRATAGVRLLPQDEREEIRDRIRARLEQTAVGETSARVISGDEEGIFGWLTVNYLLGHLEHGGPFPTVGALDLGGASTQITFVPLDGPREHEQAISVGGNTYQLYTYSYLGRGQDEARKAVDAPACYLVDYPLSEGRFGTGDFDGCREAIRAALGKPCTSEPCSLFGVHQPPVYGDFLGFSVYYYTARFFDIAGRLSPAELSRAGASFCGSSWTERVAEDPSLEGNPYVPNYCFAAAYVVTLLTDGWGFSFETDRVHAPARVQGTKVGWTLGALLYELAGGSD